MSFVRPVLRSQRLSGVVPSSKKGVSENVVGNRSCDEWLMAAINGGPVPCVGGNFKKSFYI